VSHVDSVCNPAGLVRRLQGSRRSVTRTVCCRKILPAPAASSLRNSMPTLDPALRPSLGHLPFRLAASLPASLRPDLSKIRFGYLITRLSSRKPSRPRKLSPRFPHSSVLTLIARASYLPLLTIQFPGGPREFRYRSSSWLYSALSWKIAIF